MPPSSPRCAKSRVIQFSCSLFVLIVLRLVHAASRAPDASSPASPGPRRGTSQGRPPGPDRPGVPSPGRSSLLSAAEMGNAFDLAGLRPRGFGEEKEQGVRSPRDLTGLWARNAQLAVSGPRTGARLVWPPARQGDRTTPPGSRPRPAPRGRRRLTTRGGRILPSPRGAGISLRLAPANIIPAGRAARDAKAANHRVQSRHDRARDPQCTSQCAPRGRRVVHPPGARACQRHALSPSHRAADTLSPPSPSPPSPRAS
jgi:hypothetical protein